jgi:hypothetical protein
MTIPLAIRNASHLSRVRIKDGNESAEPDWFGRADRRV